MNEIHCENVLMAMMAAVDGEEAEYSHELLDQHIAQCGNCQRELKQLRNTDQLLNKQMRSEQIADLWPVIEKRIGGRGSSQVGWSPFVLLVALLAGYKLLELLPANDLGLAFKLVPLALVVALFLLIRENPFKINTGLILER